MTEDSDLDFVIIKKTKIQRTKNIYNILNKLEDRFPCDILIYTPKEFKNRLNLGDFFIKDIIKESRVLYEKNNFIVSESVSYKFFNLNIKKLNLKTVKMTNDKFLSLREISRSETMSNQIQNLSLREISCEARQMTKKLKV